MCLPRDTNHARAKDAEEAILYKCQLDILLIRKHNTLLYLMISFVYRLHQNRIHKRVRPQIVESIHV